MSVPYAMKARVSRQALVILDRFLVVLLLTYCLVGVGADGLALEEKAPWRWHTRSEAKTEGKTFSHEEKVSTSTNTCISVAAFEGGVVQIHVDGPTPDVAFDLFKKVRAELKEDLKKK